MSVVIFGSANLDLVYRVRSLPAAGETVLALDAARNLGGKGNNQATAAARTGAETTFIGAVGDDDAGRMILDGLAEDGIEAIVRKQEGRSGNALIIVDEKGENSIVVDAGSNAAVEHPLDRELDAIRSAEVLLLQLELPVDAVAEAAAAARSAGTTVVLNAAPMTDLPDGLLDSVDLLIVNETESAQLAGSDDHHALSDVVPAFVITVGAGGAEVGIGGEELRKLAGYEVEVVDTTGAGDTFCGALAAELSARPAAERLTAEALMAAVAVANAAGALSVQRPGAVPSIPTRAEIDLFIEAHNSDA